MMSLWDALRMNMMISYQELVRTFPNSCVVTPTGTLNSGIVQLITVTTAAANAE
ncbi:type 1 fimbrial protein, partial [Klebsiella pneumoniae]